MTLLALPYHCRPPVMSRREPLRESVTAKTRSFDCESVPSASIEAPPSPSPVIFMAGWMFATGTVLSIWVMAERTLRVPGPRSLTTW